MRSRSDSKLRWCLVLAAVAIVGSSVGSWAQEAEESVKEKTERRGPLPPHYTKVVTPQQREKIYAIQETYEPRVEKLKAEMRALFAEQKKEIEAVLTPEQLQLVAKFAADAKAAQQERIKAAKAAEKKDSEASAEATAEAASGN